MVHFLTQVGYFSFVCLAYGSVMWFMIMDFGSIFLVNRPIIVVNYFGLHTNCSISSVSTPVTPIMRNKQVFGFLK